MPKPVQASLGRGASRLQVPGSIIDINDYFYECGWTDGLPIIPPTEDLVLKMLAACALPGSHVLGQLPPLNGTVTVEKVAINAVMAGCKPAYFPVVLAGVMGYALIDQFGDDKMPKDLRVQAVAGSNAATVSDTMFSQYLIPFEAVSVLLLAALVGAIVIARKDR